MQFNDGRGKPKMNVKPRYCIYCDKEIIRNTRAVTNRISPTQYLKAKFCSLGCRGAWQSENKRGSENPNWRGGKSSKTERLRGSKKYVEWRLGVFQRDRWTCQRCGITGGDLNAHHIEGFDNKKSRYLIDNGITLCVNCHNDFHNQFGRGKNNTTQFLSFIT